MSESGAIDLPSRSWGPTIPPWLWVWLVGTVIPGFFSVPTLLSQGREQSIMFFNRPGEPSPVSGQGLFVQLPLQWAFGVLLSTMITTGVVLVVLPRLRARWVEWRFKLVDDDRPVIAEMRQFVREYDPTIELRVSLRADQMARIYSAGWRRARIAVFRPLSALWRRDRESAQAVLLHELAHRRQGDHLIMGLGSPFLWAVRIGIPAYLLMVFLPAVTYLAAGGSSDIVFSGMGFLSVFVLPSALFLPVTALWLAELNADQQVAQLMGSRALQRTLRDVAWPRASLITRVAAFLSHPPQWLRLRCASARQAVPMVLLAVWPAAVLLIGLLFPFGAGLLLTPLLPNTDLSTSTWVEIFGMVVDSMLRVLLPTLIVTVVVLLAWPVFARRWERLWSSGPRRGGHQRWWPCLTAAGLPIGILFLFLVPSVEPMPQFTPPSAERRTGICAQIERWMLGEGNKKYQRVLPTFTRFIEKNQVYLISRNVNDRKARDAQARQLDTAISAALNDPPPGPVRSSFTEAMSGYRTVAHEAMRDNPAEMDPAAITDALRRATSADEKVTTQVTILHDENCRATASPGVTPQQSGGSKLEICAAANDALADFRKSISSDADTATFQKAAKDLGARMHELAGRADDTKLRSVLKEMAVTWNKIGSSDVQSWDVPDLSKKLGAACR
jgi:Zn-dependent protease with chaperone function